MKKEKKKKTDEEAPFKTVWKPVEKAEGAKPKEILKPIPAEPIVDYEVIQDANLVALKGHVRRYMKAGWNPVGGIAFHERIGMWYQAIMLREL